MTAGVLLMAYGTPRTLDEVEPYFTDIRGGPAPSPEAVEELTDRYRRIGGPSPLLEITRSQAASLERALNASQGGNFKAYVGMKHWHPYIREAVEQIAADGIDVVVGLALAPHYAKMSIGGYEDRILAARSSVGARFDLRMVASWYDEPRFVGLIASYIRDAVADWDVTDGSTRVFFTAHSLPERIIAEGDPYRDQLHESARLVTASAGITDWEFAFQSASAHGEPWLGPDILERLDRFSADGGKRALVVPIGFVADHLEILFDLDVEAVETAAELGLDLRRTRLPNADPRLADALAQVVRRALAT